MDQTVQFTINGKPQRSHETLRSRLNLLVYITPEALRAAMGEVLEFYNHQRYHEGIGNVTPLDVYYGRREETLKGRKGKHRQPWPAVQVQSGEGVHSNTRSTKG